tara:strand:+ start:40 stop:1308 length:1269 start_codon:yes stop_codon:yes gene_type:complete
MWPFNKPEVKIETKSATQVIQVNSSLAAFLGGSGGFMSASEAINLYNSTSAIAIPVNWISEAIADLDLVIIEKRGDEKVIIKDHAILDLLNNPNSHQTACDFKTSMAAMFLICGETEIAATGNYRNPPAKLYNIYPDKVSPLQGNDGFPMSFSVSGQLLNGSYSMMPFKGDSIYINNSGLAQLHQIKGFSTYSNGQLRGQSPLLSAQKEIQQIIQGIISNLTSIEKGGQMDLVFKLDDTVNLDDEEFNALKTRVLSQYSGPTGNRVSVIDGDMDIEQLGNTNRDMEFSELQSKAQESVAKVYKFPLSLLGSDAMTDNNMAAGYESFYDYAVLPKAKALYESLTIMLMPRFGLDPARFKISYDPNSITALESRKAKMLDLRAKANKETDNELREIIGRAKVDGGDVIYKKANEVPVTDAENEL